MARRRGNFKLALKSVEADSKPLRVLLNITCELAH